VASRAATTRRATALATVALALLLAMTASAPAKVYSLDDCIEAALESSTTLARARESVSGADAGVMSSWSSVLPSVSAGLSTGDNLTVANGAELAELSGSSASGNLTLRQTIFDGSSFAGISGALHSRRAVELSLEETRRLVVLNVTSAYYGLLKAEELRDVQEEAVELAREQLRKTQSLFDLGSASKSDLLKARVQVAQSELALISARKSAETARAGLRLTMGLPANGAVEVEAPGQMSAEPAAFDINLEEAVSRRPDVRAAEEQYAAARRSVLSAKAARWPDLDLSVSYSKTGEDLGDVLDTDDFKENYSRSVGLSISIPIFNGLGTKASIDAAKSNLREYEITLREARLNAEYEIESARLGVIEQRERVAVAEQSVDSAEEDLRLSEERFRLRAASMLELIDARVAYSQARVDLVEARYDYEIAKAELRNAIGLE
jgi:outer membrane protein TolC